MAKSLTNYFGEDSFYLLLLNMEKEYGAQLEKMNKAQKAFLLFYLAYFVLFYAEAVAARISAQDAIREFEILVFALRFDKSEDENPLRIADLTDLADRIVEVTHPRQHLQMIVALAEFLLKGDAEEE